MKGLLVPISNKLTLLSYFKISDFAATPPNNLVEYFQISNSLYSLLPMVFFMEMRNFLLFSLLVLVISSCQNDPDGVQELRGDGPNASIIRNPATADMPLDTNQLARMSFAEPVFNFGTIKEGDIVEHRYKFTNTGKVPLSILNARSSCGCTTPDWPKDPIPPGGTGEIYAKFNSDGRPGDQSKLVVVTANTHPNEIKLKLYGHVEK